MPRQLANANIWRLVLGIELIPCRCQHRPVSPETSLEAKVSNKYHTIFLPCKQIFLLPGAGVMRIPPATCRLRALVKTPATVCELAVSDGPASFSWCRSSVDADVWLHARLRRFISGDGEQGSNFTHNRQRSRRDIALPPSSSVSDGAGCLAISNVCSVTIISSTAGGADCAVNRARCHGAVVYPLGPVIRSGLAGVVSPDVQPGRTRMLIPSLHLPRPCSHRLILAAAVMTVMMLSSGRYSDDATLL